VFVVVVVGNADLLVMNLQQGAADGGGGGCRELTDVDVHE